ncbi:hypothetical protein [Ferrovibrio sp.]|uniref:hypothetical protein n=1 Tax=Ferrovibrio sp. TaxID=1917215 RepID=UPI000CC7EB34|nr:hypothetical protein [Ferrovibrio sp.]PJI43575.1 MAG: hypothetical protein CTR53_04790 [Ferrovibrio sp.]
MAKDEFTPFSRSLNPFRGIERNIDAMFDDSFATGAAGAMAQTHPVGATALDQPRSLFLRVVQVESGRRKG